MLRHPGLNVKCKKCQLNAQSTYLEYSSTAEGIQLESDLQTAPVETPVPDETDKLCSFLGLYDIIPISWYTLPQI